jgi:hypothetical protein
MALHTIYVPFSGGLGVKIKIKILHVLEYDILKY